jgi:hypothetical protein
MTLMAFTRASKLRSEEVAKVSRKPRTSIISSRLSSRTCTYSSAIPQLISTWLWEVSHSFLRLIRTSGL